MTLAPRALIVILLAPFVLVACSTGPGTQENTTPISITLLPYITTSPGILPVVETGTVNPATDTPTPVTYTVVAGDSMLAIAFRFGIDVTTLMLANPGVNPNAMSIGTKLIIPSSSNKTNPASTLMFQPTPVIQSTTPPDCYQTSAVEWTCFLLVTNDQPGWIEGVTGSIMIPEAGGTFTAYSPLDAIPAGASVPLITVIDLPGVYGNRMEGTLIAAVPLDENQDRFGVVDLGVPQILMADDSRSAKIILTATPPAGGKIRLVAYAMGQNNQVLGYRLWDSPDSISAGQSVDISLIVYSLAGRISSIQFAAQAQLR